MFIHFIQLRYISSLIAPKIDRSSLVATVRKRSSSIIPYLICFLLTSTNVVVLASPAADVPLGLGACPTGNSGGTAYLSQHVTADSGNNCNASEIQDLVFQLGQGGTLIVDMTCKLEGGLQLPSRFVLKGLGIGVSGQLAFMHNGAGLHGCPEEPHGYITISDLDIYGPNPAANKQVVAPDAVGIELFNQHIVYISNVRVSDFVTGISGRQSYSVFINGSNISDNRGDNIRIDYDANSWRIRDSVINQAGKWGVNVLGPGDAASLGKIDSNNDLVLDGLRMERNLRGAVRLNSYGARIINSRLESNGKLSLSYPYRAILVDTHAIETRILTNYFSGNCVQDHGIGTIRDFNIPSSYDTTECSELKWTR